MNWLNGKKTYIVSALMALVSLVHLVTGNLTLVEFISSDHMMSLFEALGLTTLRGRNPKKLERNNPLNPKKYLHFHAG